MREIKALILNLIIADDTGTEETIKLTAGSIDIAIDKLNAYKRYVEHENDHKILGDD